MKVQPTTKELIAMLYERLPELFDRPAPVQEPVAWADIDEKGAVSGLRYWSDPNNRYEVALYTTPPAQRQSARSAWVGLTDEEFKQIMLATYNIDLNVPGHYSDDYMLWNAIEAKLKEKNT